MSNFDPAKLKETLRTIEKLQKDIEKHQQKQNTPEEELELLTEKIRELNFRIVDILDVAVFTKETGVCSIQNININNHIYRIDTQNNCISAIQHPGEIISFFDDYQKPFESTYNIYGTIMRVKEFINDIDGIEQDITNQIYQIHSKLEKENSEHKNIRTTTHVEQEWLDTVQQSANSNTNKPINNQESYKSVTSIEQEFLDAINNSAKEKEIDEMPAYNKRTIDYMLNNVTQNPAAQNTSAPEQQKEERQKSTGGQELCD